MAESRKSEKEKQKVAKDRLQQKRDLAKASLDTPGGAAAGGCAVIADHDPQNMDVDSAAAAAASNFMQFGGTQHGRRDPEFHGPAEGGRSGTGAFAAEKMEIGNSSRGGDGGLALGREGIRQALGDISASDDNRLSLICGASAAARAPPLSVVMRKFPTTRSQIQRI